MTREQAEFLMSVAESEGIPASLMSDYSGRGMYGKTTYAIVTGDPMELIVAAFNAVSRQPPLPQFRDVPTLDVPRTDNMGRSDMVMY